MHCLKFFFYLNQSVLKLVQGNLGLLYSTLQMDG